jgi:menaquinone-dependent protoporphyrinogen IX oxidase
MKRINLKKLKEREVKRTLSSYNKNKCATLESLKKIIGTSIGYGQYYREHKNFGQREYQSL